MDPTFEILVEDLKGSEGYRRWPYFDTSGVETIGYGETRRDIIDRYRATGIPQDVAAELLGQRAWDDYLLPALATLTDPSALNPNQKAAIGSFTYNVGVGGWEKSTLRRYINEGRVDHDSISAAFHMWDNPDKVLRSRRQREIDLFFSPWEGKPEPDVTGVSAWELFIPLFTETSA